MASSKVTPAAERIRELSDINSDVAVMLGAAGQAIHALTNRPLHTTDEDTQMSDDSTGPLEAHKKSFQDNAEAYFHNLQAVFARLRRQAYALEDAGIITPDSSMLGATIPRAASPASAGAYGSGGPAPQQQSQDLDKIKNGGLGNFDVGWLNSRGNNVGEEKEAELVREAKELLQDVLAKR